MDLAQLLHVLKEVIMKAYSDGGLHLLMCTKLGALALGTSLHTHYICIIYVCIASLRMKL